MSLQHYMRIVPLGPNSLLPTRPSPHSVGYEVFSSEHVVVPPGGQRLLQTGLSVEFSPGSYGRLIPIFTHALNFGISIPFDIVDGGPATELLVMLANRGAFPFVVEAGDPIALLVSETVGQAPLVPQLSGYAVPVRVIQPLGAAPLPPPPPPAHEPDYEDMAPLAAPPPPPAAPSVDESLPASPRPPQTPPSSPASTLTAYTDISEASSSGDAVLTGVPLMEFKYGLMLKVVVKTFTDVMTPALIGKIIDRLKDLLYFEGVFRSRAFAVNQMFCHCHHHSPSPRVLNLYVSVGGPCFERLGELPEDLYRGLCFELSTRLRLPAEVRVVALANDFASRPSASS